MVNKSVKNLSAIIKLSKFQLFEIIQSCEIFGRLLEPLIKVGLPLIKHVLAPLAMPLLISLGLTLVSVADTGIHKNILHFGTYSSGMKKIIISKKEMEDIMKLIRSLEGSGLLIKGVN